MSYVELRMSKVGERHPVIFDVNREERITKLINRGYRMISDKIQNTVLTHDTLKTFVSIQHEDVYWGDRAGELEREQEERQVMTDTGVTTPRRAWEIADGTYTIVDANNDYRTIHIEQATRGNLRGKTIISILTGPNNSTDFQGVAFYDPSSGRVQVWSRFRNGNLGVELTRAIAAITRDPAAAGEAYALMSGRCCKCGRKLTVPASINRGLGPECARQRAQSV